MRGEDELLSLAAAAVKRARVLGADAAEAYVREGRTTSLLAQGPLFSPNASFAEGVGVRVIVGGRLGSSAGDALTTLDDVVHRALEGARSTSGRSLPWSFPPSAAPASPLPAHPTLVAGDEEHVNGVAERVHRRLLGAPGVTYVGTTVRSTYRRFAVANSEGVEAYGETGQARLEVEVRVTEGGKDRTARDSLTRAGPLGPEAALDALADAAVADARSALADAPLATPVHEAVLAPAAAAQVVEIFLSSLSGHAAHAGKTPLAGRLGERVVSDLLTLRDAPRGPVGRMHRAVDDEGVPTRDATLVERGVLRAFVHDASSARAAGLPPPGQGLRTSPASVEPRAVNPVVEPGEATLAEILERTERAVLVTQPLLGAFVANHVTGDFSVVAPFAHLVEGGRVRHALPATTVAGNVHRLLASVSAVADAPQVFLPVTVPALRAGGVSCAT